MPTKRKTTKTVDPPDVWGGEKPYVSYVDEITLPDKIEIGDIEKFVENVREIGSADWKNRVVTFEVRAFTEWELRGLADELTSIIENWVGEVYVVNYSKSAWHGKPGITTDRLIAELADLRDHGYQPMYNGRPSCPFCGQFIDAEETHDPNCVLLELVLEH